MKIALIGSTGFIGTCVASELLSRGHRVTALARNPDKVEPKIGLSVVLVDVYDHQAVADAVTGHDAVVSAFNPGWQEPDLYEKYIAGTESIVCGVEASGVKRLLVVGGAGSLLVAPDTQLVDTPEFAKQVPAFVVPGARAARDALNSLRDNTRLDWTLISPPAFLEAGARTGEYRLGGDRLLMDGDKPAGITVPDLAVAIVDELEKPRYVRSRFTVARIA